MLPQPPPDAPAPPPSEAALRSRQKWRWMWIAGVLSIFGLLVFAVVPKIVSQRKMADQSEAIGNASQTGVALIEFQEEYGKFPDSTTIAAVQSKTGSLLPMGTKTSNDFFRQLLAAGITGSEGMVYADVAGIRKPDGRMDGSDAMDKGECGFTYFLGATKSDNPRRPLLVTPMIPGTQLFDPEPFGGKAVVLRMDGKVILLTIDEFGHAILDGRNLMDPHHPIWDGHAPVIAWPDL